MQERTRYRITGSLFLLAVAIIVLPMLFDKPAPDRLPPIDSTQTVATVKAEVAEVALVDAQDLVPVSDVVEEVAALKAEVDGDGFRTDNGVRVGEPVLVPLTAATRVYAVQAGSFVEQDNAYAFRDRLQGSKYEAFISTTRSGAVADQLVPRVAIGPLLARDDGERILAELKAMNIEAQLVGMTP